MVNKFPVNLRILLDLKTAMKGINYEKSHFECTVCVQNEQLMRSIFIDDLGELFSLK